MPEKVIKVGVGVMIFKDGKVLLGKSKASNNHKDQEFSFPGGHLEHNESLIESVKRETREECGVEIDNVKFSLIANIREFYPKHYIGFGFIADWKVGEPKVLEPDKFDNWDWYDMNNLPEPLYVPTKMMIDAYNNKTNFLDA